MPLLKTIFEVEDSLLRVLERTALKFQTVKASIKGKNPGDFIELINEKRLYNFLGKLFLPPSIYLKEGR